MRRQKDRRKTLDPNPFRDYAVAPRQERRKSGERRMENLDTEERQLLFSEMPSPTQRKPR